MLKNKKVIVLSAVITLGLCFTSFSAGKWVQAFEDNTIKITYNGVTKKMYDSSSGRQIYPLLYNGKTYLPVRDIANLTGLSISLDNAKHVLKIASPDYKEQSTQANNGQANNSQTYDLTNDPIIKGLSFKETSTTGYSTNDDVIKLNIANVAKYTVEGRLEEVLQYLHPTSPIRQTLISMNNNFKGKEYTLETTNENIIGVGYKNGNPQGAIVSMNVSIKDKDGNVLSSGVEKYIAVYDPKTYIWYYYCALVQ